MAYFEWAADMVIDKAILDDLLRYTEDHLRREELLMK